MRPLIDDAKRREHRLSASMSVKSTSAYRRSSDRLPERFKDGDDAQVDFTAPPPGMGSRDGNVHYMQQSLFSMIAAVGSRSDFRARFDDSSDSDGEVDENQRKELMPDDPSRESSSNRCPTSGKFSSNPRDGTEERGRHRRAISDNEPLRKLPLLGSKGKEAEPSTLSRSSLTVKPRRTRSVTPRAAPVLTRMVQAQNRFDMAAAPEQLPSRPETPSEDRPQTSGSALSTRLMEMFGFERPEKVLVEYACALLQSMLLQGYMYVTEGHICFYAYLPKKASAAIKSGYLAKRGRKNPKYNRYWFILKGDVFSYYADPSNLYFPHGHVDLRYGISASLAEPKPQGSEVKDFNVTTDQRTYYFRADSATNAKEWVKALQKVIFRTHNEGDSVKVSFPIENVIDLEESPMAEFAETFKIRVVDTNETYAIDEVSLLSLQLMHSADSLVPSIFSLSSTRAKMLSTT